MKTYLKLIYLFIGKGMKLREKITVEKHYKLPLFQFHKVYKSFIDFSHGLRVMGKNVNNYFIPKLV